VLPLAAVARPAYTDAMKDPKRATTTADLASARDLLERLMDLGDRHLFQLSDGRPFEGWVVEVGEAGVLVMAAGPLASEEPVEIPLDAIDLGTLRYVDGGVVVPFATA
jgi:hypothetical protein